MKITINDQITILDLKGEFSERFPFLKLEFFSTEHANRQPSAKRDIIDDENIFGKIRTNHHSGHITINGDMTVTELEKKFHDVYGLNVQVFRKSGSVWLETTVTDYMTLNEQNKLAREKTLPIERESDSEIDYD